MTKQYRINSMVEAVKLSNTSLKDLTDFFGSAEEAAMFSNNPFYEDYWAVKKIHGGVIVMSDNRFKAFYSEVEE